jgi:meso-butanediol dehydrogenase/(S,S)-butanediol dehydrogenase/diacetyl reductase
LTVSGRLHGKTALISGGNRGIGRAIAQAFAAEGADLVLTARDADLLGSVAEALREAHGIRCVTFSCDITDEPAVHEMVERAGADAPIDVLVNNAGIYSAGRFLDLTSDDFRRVFDVNFYGLLHLTQAVLPMMIRRKTGRVINIASTAGKWGAPYQSAYNTSKHAVVGLTRCIALETAEHNVLVNAICPWFVETDMMPSFVNGRSEAAGVAPEKLVEKWKSAAPLKRFLRSEEVAPLAVFLAADESSYVTGQTWAVDGGVTMI